MAEKKQTTKIKEESKSTSKSPETNQEKSGVGKSIVNILKKIWLGFYALVKRFVGLFVTIFRKLGFILSIVLIALVALGIWGTYRIGYERGEDQAIENLAEEYGVTREGIIELLEQGTRTFRD